MSKFLTIHEAAKRVGRSTRTLRRWTENGLKLRGGLIREDELLEQDRLMRERLGRPRKVEPGAVVLADVADERARQNAKWGEQNHRDGTGDRACIFHGRPIPKQDRDAELTMGRLSELARRVTDEAAERGVVTWADILLEEVFEALAESDPEALRTELIQVSAVAAQWAEAIDRRKAAA